MWPNEGALRRKSELTARVERTVSLSGWTLSRRAVVSPCLYLSSDLQSSCMIEDVRHHLEAGPFEPFAIVTSNGHRYDIPSPDHAGINPRRNRVVIWFDDGGHITLSALHITAVEKIAGTKK